MFNLPPLAAQKPSEPLAEMLRLCPRGLENNAFFNCLFLNKLTVYLIFIYIFFKVYNILLL